MKLIYCRGGDKVAPKVAAYAGWYYGKRGDYVDYTSVYMLDWDFSKPWTEKRWDKYIADIRSHKPEMALVPDYFGPHERDDMLKHVDSVLQAGANRAAVCPKFLGAIADIPKHCIVALSVPTEYAGWLPPEHETIGRDLHLLGGHPDQWLYLLRNRYKQANYISADGNAIALKAGHGQWWSARRADWIQAPSRRYESLIMQMHSAKMISCYLSNPKSKVRMREPVRKCVAPRIHPDLLPTITQLEMV